MLFTGGLVHMLIILGAHLEFCPCGYHAQIVTSDGNGTEFLASKQQLRWMLELS